MCLVNNNECSGDKNRTLICLADRRKRANKSQFPKAHTEAQTILYRADIKNESKINFSKTFIYDRHFNRLLVQFNPKKNKWCYTCALMSGLSPPSTKQLRQISRKYALRIHANFNLKHSYGEFICGTCRKGYNEFKRANFSKRVSDFIERRKNRQCATTNAQTMNVCDDDIKYTSSEEDSDTNADKDFVPGSDKESTRVMREALKHLLNLCSNKNRAWITQNCQKLTGRTRLNYLLRSRSIIKAIISIMAPNDVNQLEHDLFDHHDDKDVVKLDGHFLSVMEVCRRPTRTPDRGPHVVKFFRSLHLKSVLN